MKLFLVCAFRPTELCLLGQNGKNFVKLGCFAFLRPICGASSRLGLGRFGLLPSHGTRPSRVTWLSSKNTLQLVHSQTDSSTYIGLWSTYLPNLPPSLCPEITSVLFFPSPQTPHMFQNWPVFPLLKERGAVLPFSANAEVREYEQGHHRRLLRVRTCGSLRQLFRLWDLCLNDGLYLGSSGQIQ